MPEQLHALILETATDGVVATDEAGCVAYANPAAENMFGAGAEELIGRSLAELMPEHFAEASSLGLAHYLASVVPEMLGHTVELIGRRRDGTEFPIDLSFGSWTSNGKLHFAGIMRDVTERKKMEAQLLVADRRIAVDTLSASVAHEINNPLAAIIGNLDLAMRDLGEVLDEQGEGGALLRLREELLDARDAADRVRKIVRDLRLFSRGGDEVPGPADGQVATQVAQVAHAPRRRGRILVVDDEPLVAKVVSRSLDKQHEVIGLDRSAEALALVLGGERFDVILCDLMMPEMSGIDFYQALCAHVPQQASVVVFMTGGAFTPRARRFLDEVPNRWLAKPFDPVALSSLVNASIPIN